jgi:hypothetical protein
MGTIHLLVKTKPFFVAVLSWNIDNIDFAPREGVGVEITTDVWNWSVLRERQSRLGPLSVRKQRLREQNVLFHHFVTLGLAKLPETVVTQVLDQKPLAPAPTADRWLRGGLRSLWCAAPIYPKRRQDVLGGGPLGFALWVGAHKTTWWVRVDDMERVILSEVVLAALGLAHSVWLSLIRLHSGRAAGPTINLGLVNLRSRRDSPPNVLDPQVPARFRACEWWELAHIRTLPHPA